MKVFIPSELHSYTGKRLVDADGGTLDELLRELDHRYPGLRFRIVNEQEHVRQHIRIFVNSEQVFDLTTALRPLDEVRIVGALSGG